MAPEIPGPTILRFGVFEVDLRAGEAHRQGVRIKLQEQPFQVLTTLLRRAGDVVTREELRAQLWHSDTFVDFDNGLNTSINKLREALGDSADNPRFIETLPRRGYRFIAPVTGVDRKTRETATGVSAASSARSRKIVVTVIVVLLAAGIAGRLLWQLRKARLTEKDTIVLADFANTTGELVFDDTLKQGLRVQLEQSPFLNILSDQRVNEVLQQMGHPKDGRLTQEVTREVCLRAGSKALLIGAISSLGTQYVIGLKALNCQTGDALASEQVEVDDREHVLKGLGDSATSVRRKLGESLTSIQKYDVPLEQATTPSLEALKAYSMGLRTWGVKGETAAFPFLKRAIDLDPNFAMAYASMGVMHGNLSQLDLSSENIRRAYELRGNTSERERLYIESNYYAYVTGEREKTAQALEVRAQIYPRDFGPHNNLANAYSDLGRHEQALEEALIAMRLDPDIEDNYVTLGNSYLCLNRLNEAEAVLKQAEERKVESEGLAILRYQVAFLKGNEEEMERLAAALAAKPGAEDLLQSQKEISAVYHGRLRKAWEIVHVSMNPGERHDSVTMPALSQAGLGLLEAHVGKAQQARADANEALRRSAPKDFPRWISALALALAGDAKGAAKLAEELDKSLPLTTGFQRFWGPSIRAVIAMDNKNPNKAVELLQTTTPYELGTMGSLDPIYFRGMAYLELGNGAAAATEFKKIIEHPGIVRNWPVGALAHLGLGRASVLQGNKDKARAAYQDFLTLWKDADSDIPILVQAKAEYAKLR
jgi:DNA-binding winged helix-turn-helix (wHTH) protein/tetratricopeptide (TPR) repeat protein